MTPLQSAKMNGVDPMAWLTDVLERIVSGQPELMNSTRCYLGIGSQSKSARSTNSPRSARPQLAVQVNPVAATTLTVKAVQMIVIPAHEKLNYPVHLGN